MINLQRIPARIKEMAKRIGAKTWIAACAVLLLGSVVVINYVLTGGELAAAVMADSLVRVIPGVISDEQSALSDSFQDNLLAPPVYTRPAEYKGWRVPDVLLSGHEAKIRDWEFQQSLERTKRLRPDLLNEK